MTHFSLEQWTDYVRGVADDPTRSAMTAHLDGGCPRCARAVDLLRRVAGVVAIEPQYQVPEHAVRCARAIFAVQRPQTMRLPRAALHLIYDSIREPLPAGIRSAERLARRVLYQAGNFFLDIRVEREPGSPRLSLVGQLANCDTPSQHPTGVLVLLATGDNVIARAITNRFGEFELDYLPGPNLRLFLPLDAANARIELPLSRVTADVLRERKKGKVLNEGPRRVFGRRGGGIRRADDKSRS
jgi:hypothetical protein